MKQTILFAGAGGTIGSALCRSLEEQGHRLIKVSRTSGDYKADMGDKAAMEAVFKAVGHFDAVLSAAGEVVSYPLDQLTDEHFAFAIAGKMMGQINLARNALPYITDKGSITLVSGILSEEPILGGVIGTMVNGAVEGFVKAAAAEMPRGIRINCVSPNVLAESEAFHPYFPGFVPVEAWRVVKAYERSLLGIINGRVLPV